MKIKFRPKEKENKENKCEDLGQTNLLKK